MQLLIGRPHLLLRRFILFDQGAQALLGRLQLGACVGRLGAGDFGRRGFGRLIFLENYQMEGAQLRVLRWPHIENELLRLALQFDEDRPGAAALAMFDRRVQGRPQLDTQLFARKPKYARGNLAAGNLQISSGVLGGVNDAEILINEQARQRVALHHLLMQGAIARRGLKAHARRFKGADAAECLGEHRQPRFRRGHVATPIRAELFAFHLEQRRPVDHS